MAGEPNDFHAIPPKCHFAHTHTNTDAFCVQIWACITEFVHYARAHDIKAMERNVAKIQQNGRAQPGWATYLQALGIHMNIL